MMADSAGPVKILLTSVDALGHLNSTLGLAGNLLARGNEVYVTNRRKHEATITRRGLKFIALEDFEDSYNQTNGEVFLNIIVQFMSKMSLTPMERLETWSEADNGMMKGLFAELQLMDKALRKIVDSLKPDILIGDVIMSTPLFIQCPIPCIQLFSANPISIYHKYGLPAGTGYSVKGDKSLWKKYIDKERSIFTELMEDYTAWYKSYGLDVPDIFALRSFTKFFGIYIYPEALDYTDLGPPPDKWVRMDFSIRKADELLFEIPETLSDKPGSLIYFSMGSLGSVHIELMKRLLETLSKSKHRFIVSKGPRGDALTLHDNMWGQNYVNQLAILPKVDLVITHGGNNTIVETLYFGKPMIVMPLFFDQLDNAQRLEDLEIGRRVDPFRYEDDELHSMIDNLLGDIELHAKIAAISSQLKSSSSRDKVAEMIEKTGRTQVGPFDA